MLFDLVRMRRSKGWEYLDIIIYRDKVNSHIISNIKNTEVFYEAKSSFSNTLFGFLSDRIS